MKKKFIERLKCLNCPANAFDLSVKEENEEEIREGDLKCRECGRVYPIHFGVLNMLPEKLPEEVKHEKEHAESFDYIVNEDGGKWSINRETAAEHRGLFLSLPQGDTSHYFKPGGSFDNQAGNASRYFKTLDYLNLPKGARVLEVGASFGWSPWRFAQRGCDVTALDVTNYLEVADVYFGQDGAYFERLMADMSTLPFADNSYDVIFSHSVIHHCKDLAKLFSDFKRVLKPGGRVVALHECSFGIFEDKSGAALQEAIDEGFNENAYTVPQWTEGPKKAGFRKVETHFFSFIDDYVDRKLQRQAKVSGKLKLAQAIQKMPWLSGMLNALSVPFRILLRPKAWMLIATK